MGLSGRGAPSSRGKLAHSSQPGILREQRELAFAGGLRQAGDVAPAVLVRAVPLRFQVLLELGTRCAALQPPRLLVEAADGIELLRPAQARCPYGLLEDGDRPVVHIE